MSDEMTLKEMKAKLAEVTEHRERFNKRLADMKEGVALIVKGMGLTGAPDEAIQTVKHKFEIDIARMETVLPITEMLFQSMTRDVNARELEEQFNMEHKK